MNRLNKDELRILVQYLDNDSIRNFAQVMLHIDPEKSLDIINCAMDQLIEEREDVERGLKIVLDTLTSIENISKSFDELL